MRTAFAMLLACLPAAAVAQEAPPGALSCTGCHDPAAQTELSLDGLSAENIVTAVKDMRSGARESTIMNRIAAGFTDDEIRAIADWIAKED